MGSPRLFKRVFLPEGDTSRPFRLVFGPRAIARGPKTSLKGRDVSPEGRNLVLKSQGLPKRAAKIEGNLLIFAEGVKGRDLGYFPSCRKKALITVIEFLGSLC